MPAIKIYKCCICHEVLEEYKPVRLTRQKYGLHHRNQYSPEVNYDFCKKCYAKFNNWIKKNEVKE